MIRCAAKVAKAQRRSIECGKKRTRKFTRKLCRAHRIPNSGFIVRMAHPVCYNADSVSAFIK